MKSTKFKKIIGTQVYNYRQVLRIYAFDVQKGNADIHLRAEQTVVTQENMERLRSKMTDDNSILNKIIAIDDT